MKTLVLASNNLHKIEEFRQILNDYKILCLNDIEYYDDIIEDGSTFLENALIKVNTIYDYLKSKNLDYIVVGDDSGLCVKALNNAPGIYSARYAGNHDDKQNRKKLLQELENKNNREAFFICQIAVKFPNGEIKWCDGKVFGKILTKETGKTDFGYDCLFYCDELNCSFGQASSEDKNKVSHRKRAIEKLKLILNDFKG